MTRFRWGSATDAGRVRQVNEDSMLAVDGLFAVADGDELGFGNVRLTFQAS